jgi:hypothetical protein
MDFDSKVAQLVQKHRARLGTDQAATIQSLNPRIFTPAAPSRRSLEPRKIASSMPSSPLRGLSPRRGVESIESTLDDSAKFNFEPRDYKPTSKTVTMQPRTPAPDVAVIKAGLLALRGGGDTSVFDDIIKHHRKLHKSLGNDLDRLAEALTAMPPPPHPPQSGTSSTTPHSQATPSQDEPQPQDSSVPVLPDSSLQPDDDVVMARLDKFQRHCLAVERENDRLRVALAQSEMTAINLRAEILQLTKRLAERGL